MKPSEIWSIAAGAAERRLPADSAALINRFDDLSRKWGREGCPFDPTHEAHAARRACEADPFAGIVLELRGRAADAYYKERYGRPLLTPEQAAYALREAGS